MMEAITTGFVASKFLYEKTHVPGFPETGRYTLGGVVVMICYAILYPGDREGLRRVFTAFAAAGLGVGLARISGALI